MLRQLDLKKNPSVSETLDGRALVAQRPRSIDVLGNTLTVLLKKPTSSAPPDAEQTGSNGRRVDRFMSRAPGVAISRSGRLALIDALGVGTASTSGSAALDAVKDADALPTFRSCSAVLWPGHLAADRSPGGADAGAAANAPGVVAGADGAARRRPAKNARLAAQRGRPQPGGSRRPGRAGRTGRYAIDITRRRPPRGPALAAAAGLGPAPGPARAIVGGAG